MKFLSLFLLTCFFHTLYATPLGVDYSKQRTTFSIWSPDTDRVELQLVGKRYPMLLGENSVYVVSVDGDWESATYNYRIDGRRARDPYARMVRPGSDQAIVINPKKTTINWSKRPTLVNREDSIIYEMHVRDFTMDHHWGGSAKLRGKFLGMVEPGTRYQGLATGIDYLKELGVTHIQLMPSYDFLSCSVRDPSFQSDRGDECYNWGYDPENFNVPEERYSLTPYDYHNRIKEFKTMVNEFHKAGIRVIMDVVYNHTAVFATEGETLFSPISTRYFTENDLSGTGNSVNATIPMVSRFIQDSMEYWVSEFNVDGFRMDLMGIFDYKEVERWAKYLNEKYSYRNLLIYGEPWNGYAADEREPERVRPGTIYKLVDQHVGIFNPSFRQAIKGNNDNGQGGGFAFSDVNLREMMVGVTGSLVANYNEDPAFLWDSYFAKDPEQTINYVSAHDNLSLRDKILEWAKLSGQNNEDYLERIQMFAGGIILTSQGIPFLHGGVEFLRSKGGDHNSYRSSDEVNKIYWQNRLTHSNILTYYKNLILLRKQHRAFRMTSWEQIHRYIKSYPLTDKSFVVRIDGAAVGDRWSDIFMIYNSGINQKVDLPSGKWRVAFEKSLPHLADGREVEGSIDIEGTAVTILYR